MNPPLAHPAVWHAHQLPAPSGQTVSSGHPALDHALPGRGWPLGTLIELLPGLANSALELSLLQPCLQALPSRSLIVLLAPPYPPCQQAWMHHGLTQQRLLWINPNNSADAFWAATQLLRHQQHSVVCYWAPQTLAYAQQRQLHVLARQSKNLLFLITHANMATQSSPAPLRIRYQPASRKAGKCWGLSLNLLKPSARQHEHDIYLPVWQYAQTPTMSPPHTGTDLLRSSHESLSLHCPAVQTQRH